MLMLFRVAVVYFIFLIVMFILIVVVTIVIQHLYLRAESVPFTAMSDWVSRRNFYLFSQYIFISVLQFRQEYNLGNGGRVICFGNFTDETIGIQGGPKK